MKSLLLLTMISMFLFVSESHAFRCGNRLINEGDSMAMVKKRCGAPELAERRQIEQIIKYVSGESRTTFLNVEQWLYDMGSNQLIRRLRFEDDKLVSMKTREHGSSRQPDAKQCHLPWVNRNSINDILSVQYNCGRPDRINQLGTLTVRIQQREVSDLFVVKKLEEWIFENEASGKNAILRFEDGKLTTVTSEYPADM